MALSLAAQSNAMGVSCLAKGECQRAFLFFNEALQRCSLAARQAEDIQESSESMQEVTVYPQQIECSYQGSSSQEDDQHPISLFNQPLLFSTPNLVAPGISVVSSCTATIMFNMALSLCQGNFSQRRKAVKNAAHLFQSAVNLMEQLPNSSTQALVTVASLNNKACLYYRVGDLEQSKSCAESLMMALSKAKQHRQQQQQSSLSSIGMLQEETMDDFALGAVSVSGIRVASAA